MMNPKRLTVAGLLLSWSFVGLAQDKKVGILLLAHGGSESWNVEVTRLAAQVERSFPTEVAFGMAAKQNIQDSIDRLVQRGVGEIIAVPLFVSSHSSVITATQYLLGTRREAPPELAKYARMSHSHGSHTSLAAEGATFDPTTPVRSPAPIRMTAALDRHPLAAEILLTRARSISQDREREVVIVVAHGPVADEENTRWLADMGALAERMRATGDFEHVEYLTLRDDAPEPTRSQATAQLRATVQRAAAQGRKALIVPLLISYGGIEAGIRKRLDGLDYVMAAKGLLPDDRLAQWVVLAAQQ